MFIVGKLIWRKNIIPPDAISTVSVLHSVSFLGKVKKAAIDNLHVWQYGSLILKN